MPTVHFVESIAAPETQQESHSFAEPISSPAVHPLDTKPATDMCAGSRDSGPPRRGWGLGLRLALLVSITVAGVMAAISGWQLAADLRSELQARRSLLAASVSPLVSELQSASDFGAAAAVLERFHASYVGAGHVDHYIALAAPDGSVLLRAGEQTGTLHPLTVSVPLSSVAVGGDGLQLVVSQRDERLSTDRSRRWRAWAIHVAVTALVIVLLLFIVIRREVTGPIERLLGGIRKMELGYWDDVADPGGAWELRWLAWRFRTIGGELRLATGNLMAAQRRAYAAEAGAQADACATIKLPATAAATRPDDVLDQLLNFLQARLACLRTADPRDAETRRLAELTWHRDAQQAERIGFAELRICLEDAALRVLQPEAFSNIEREVKDRRLILARIGVEISNSLEKALAARGVPFLSITHRIKHVAGVWKKMREKDLSLDQVHDLLAMRIVVPTVSDCYHALGVVHDLREPRVDRFKDYIAQPKPNGYQGLHTTVQGPDGFVFEVQIRSLAMHQLAEHGDASHSEYKAANSVAVVKPTMRATLKETIAAGERRSLSGTPS